VLIYFELCEKIWGGSPATEQIEGGVESVDLDSNNTLSASHTSNGEGETSTDGIDEDANSEDTSRETSGELSEGPSQSVVQQRRQFLDKKLDSYRHEKLKRKLPVDVQLLKCAEEELQVKKRLVDRMGQVDKQYAENMAKMTQNMEKLTESISEGFSLLKTFLMFQQPSSMFPSQGPYPSYVPGSPHVFSPRIPGYPSTSNDTHPQSLHDHFNASSTWEETQ